VCLCFYIYVSFEQKQPSLDNYAKEACRRGITQLLAAPHTHSPSHKDYSNTAASPTYDDETIVTGIDTTTGSNADKTHCKRASLQESVQSTTIDVAAVSEDVKTEVYSVLYSATSVLPPLLNKLESFFDNSKYYTSLSKQHKYCSFALVY
jgi:hypothetical protein